MGVSLYLVILTLKAVRADVAGVGLRVGTRGLAKVVLLLQACATKRRMVLLVDEQTRD